MCVAGGLFVDSDGILKVRPDNDTIRLVQGPQGESLALSYRPTPAVEWPWAQTPSWGHKVFEYNGRLYGAPGNSVFFAENTDAWGHWTTLNGLGNTYRLAQVIITNSDPLRRDMFIEFTAIWGGYNIHLPSGGKSAFIAQMDTGAGFPETGGINSKHHNTTAYTQDFTAGHISGTHVVPVLKYGETAKLGIRWRIHTSPNEHYVPPTGEIVGGFYHCSVSAKTFVFT
jgi:hypothetical protein